MIPQADAPQPKLRLVGQRPVGETPAPAPYRLALALREHALKSGLTMCRLERSRVKHSGSIYLTMAQPSGRAWIMRVSNHMRPRRTGHALPHIDLVSFDGVSGFNVGRGLIDSLIAGDVPWFDANATIRCLQHAKHRKGKRGGRK